jgi:hypothetical protein
MSATVQAAIEAAEQADAEAAPTAKPKGRQKPPESAEVKAAAKAKAKYSPELKAAAKRAEELRGKARTVGPVQVQRVQSALAGRKPLDALGMTIKDATAYAGGSADVKASDKLKELGTEMADPFCRGRGAAAILLALHEQSKK